MNCDRIDTPKATSVRILQLAKWHYYHFHVWYSTHAHYLHWSQWWVSSWEHCASDHWGYHRCRIGQLELVNHGLDVHTLIYWNCYCGAVMQDLELQEPADGDIVGDLPIALNVSLEPGDVLSLFWGYCHVICCDHNDCVLFRLVLEENQVVNCRISRSKILYEDPAHFLVTPMACLL